jgi:peptidoglycan/xylan/chitin deacetylase (PgdA/CDA1 family)
MRRLRRPIDGLALVDRLARATGILSWMRRRRCATGVTILMYHKVLPQPAAAMYPLQNLVVEKSSFMRQMEWLASHFEVVTVGEAMARLNRDGEGMARPERPLACVTFDDGYRDNFDHAAPVLNLHGLRGTFFITTGFVQGEPLWFDRAALAWRSAGRGAALKACDAMPECRELLAQVESFESWWEALKGLQPGVRRRVLDAAESTAVKPDEIFGAMGPGEVAKLSAHGHEIGSHSATHPILSSLDDYSLRWEMEESRARVFEWTGRKAAGFCYPNGDHDPRVVEAASNAGYEYACVLHRGLAKRGANPLRLPRRGILSSGRREMTDDAFEAEVVGWHDLMRESRRKLSTSWSFPR